MKKIISLITLTVLLFVSCKKTDTMALLSKKPNQTGINISSSENIELIKKMVDQVTKFDMVDFRSNFAPSAILHDNRKNLTVDENVKMLEDLKAKGIVFTMGKEPLIWEVINDKPDTKTGVTNYVISYYETTFTKGTKSVVIVYNMNFAMKDGKIQEEWDMYDSADLVKLINE
jgi:hypothetical protein